MSSEEGMGAPCVRRMDCLNESGDDSRQGHTRIVIPAPVAAMRMR
jgi:hypothetical protein